MQCALFMVMEACESSSSSMPAAIMACCTDHWNCSDHNKFLISIQTHAEFIQAARTLIAKQRHSHYSNTQHDDDDRYNDQACEYALEPKRLDEAHKWDNQQFSNLHNKTASLLKMGSYTIYIIMTCQCTRLAGCVIVQSSRQAPPATGAAR